MSVKWTELNYRWSNYKFELQNLRGGGRLFTRNSLIPNTNLQWKDCSGKILFGSLQLATKNATRNSAISLCKISLSKHYKSTMKEPRVFQNSFIWNINIQRLNTQANSRIYSIKLSSWRIYSKLIPNWNVTERCTARWSSKLVLISTQSRMR